jgi:hypothetical protein
MPAASEPLELLLPPSPDTRARLAVLPSGSSASLKQPLAKLDALRLKAVDLPLLVLARPPVAAVSAAPVRSVSPPGSVSAEGAEAAVLRCRRSSGRC